MEYQDIICNFKNPQLLKEGGQKVVYLIEDNKGNPVVIKIGSYKSPSALERIKREVMLLREIHSDYYPKNLDFNLFSNNRFIITEEYIPFPPLSGCFNRFASPQSILPFIKSLVIGLQVLWDKNTVHRDIKPDNILVCQNNSPKIIDLGIARLMDLDSLTYTIAPWGPCTPFYAAPEQLTNRKTEIDYRTDQFNLGILLIQLLLQGQHPFDPNLVMGGDSIPDNILNGRWYKSILDLPENQPLKPLAQKLLGREPYQRYRKIDNLLKDIEQCMEVIR